MMYICHYHLLRIKGVQSGFGNLMSCGDNEFLPNLLMIFLCNITFSLTNQLTTNISVNKNLNFSMHINLIFFIRIIYILMIFLVLLCNITVLNQLPLEFSLTLTNVVQLKYCYEEPGKTSCQEIVAVEASPRSIRGCE